MYKRRKREKKYHENRDEEISMWKTMQEKKNSMERKWWKRKGKGEREAGKGRY